LLIGQLSLDIKTRWNGGFVEGQATAGITGSISIDDLIAGFELAAIKGFIGAPDITGQANIRIKHLLLKDNWPVELLATGEIRDLSSSLMGRGDAARIGSVGIDFDTSTATDVNTLKGVIEDTGGALEISGTLLLTKPTDYGINVRVKARPEASQALQSNLAFLGTTESDGSRIFQLAGSL